MRTLPVLAGVNPSISSSSVVLPAPFLPSTPTTSPGCTANDTPSSTRFGPKDLPSFSALTWALVIGFTPLLSQGPHDLAFGQLQLASRQHEMVEGRLDLLEPLRCRAIAARLRGDGHRLAAMAFEQPFRLEQAVCARDRHRVDRMRQRQIAHRR